MPAPKRKTWLLDAVSFTRWKEMNKQRKVLITITYNEMGIIMDTKAEELDSSAKSEVTRCKDCGRYDGSPCGLVSWYNGEDDYCSRAERRCETHEKA